MKENLARIGVYSLLINIFLASLKLGLATLSGSLALAADAIHSLVDVFASLAVLGGLLIAKRKSKAFPYGLYKVENVVSVGIALLIFLAGYEIARDALTAGASLPTINGWVLAGVSLTIVIPLLFGGYEARVGRASGSPSLIADGKHFQTDVLSSVAVLVAVVGRLFGLALDRIAAGVVVLFIAHAGWELLADGMRVLLDASIDAETLNHIRGIITSEPGVADVKWLTGRNSGRFRFIEAEITLRFHDLEKAHAATQRIEEKIRQDVPNVDRVLIHAEPVERTHTRYAVPLADPQGTISEHFGEAPYFALITVRLADGQIEAQQIVANPYTAEDKAKGILVSEWLVSQKADVVLLKEDLQGKGPTYVFGEAGTEIMPIAATTLTEVVAALTAGKVLQGVAPPP